MVASTISSGYVHNGVLTEKVRVAVRTESDWSDDVFAKGYRLMLLDSGAEIDRSYSAQFYDLAALAGFAGPVLELGRFCIRPDRRDHECGLSAQFSVLCSRFSVES